MTSIYARAYTEVIEIISHFSQEEYSKIPIEKIEFYKNNMDKEYTYKINPKEDLSKQNISKEANSILVSLFRDYFANEKQKLILEELLEQNQLKQEKEKEEKYNSNNIFKDTKKENNQNKELIVKETKRKNFIIKIFEFFNVKKRFTK